MPRSCIHIAMWATGGFVGYWGLWVTGDFVGYWGLCG